MRIERFSRGEYGVSCMSFKLHNMRCSTPQRRKCEVTHCIRGHFDFVTTYWGACTSRTCFAQARCHTCCGSCSLGVLGCLRQAGQGLNALQLTFAGKRA